MLFNYEIQSHGHLGKFRPRALRDLSKEQLEQTIQTGEHDPVSVTTPHVMD